jgi:hypothetical protein
VSSQSRQINITKSSHMRNPQEIISRAYTKEENCLGFVYKKKNSNWSFFAPQSEFESWEWEKFPFVWCAKFSKIQSTEKRFVRSDIALHSCTVASRNNSVRKRSISNATECWCCQSKWFWDFTWGNFFGLS